MNDPKNDKPNLPVKIVETSSAAVAEQQKAIIYAHYELAMRRPRDVDVTRTALLHECKRPSFAKVARYNKPIGKGVTGPSIRFAEAAIRHYKNILILTQTVFDDTERRIVNVKCIDVESNLSYCQDVTVVKTVERKALKQGENPIKTRLNSKGEMLYILEATDDDILNKQNALISKAIRTQGLRLIPGDIVDECMNEVIDTQRDADAKDPEAAKKALFDAFVEIGVQVKDIKSYLKNDAETLTPKELADLRGIYQAIKDGELTWRDVLDRDNDQKEPKEPAGKGLSGAQKKLTREPGQDDDLNDPRR